METFFSGPRNVPEIIRQENNYFLVIGYYDYLCHYASSPWKSKGKQQWNGYKQWLMRILRNDGEATTLWNPPQKWYLGIHFHGGCPKCQTPYTLFLSWSSPFPSPISHSLFPSFFQSVFIVPVYFPPTSSASLSLPIFVTSIFFYLLFPHFLILYFPNDVS